MFAKTVLLAVLPATPPAYDWGFGCSWTDDVGIENWGLGSVAAQGTPPSASVSGQWTFKVKAHTPVSFYTSQDNPGSSGSYELFFTLERLQ